MRYALDALRWSSSRRACSRAASSHEKTSGGKSEASKTWRISTSAPSPKGAREAQSIASCLDFAWISQKPATRSLAPGKGPSVTLGSPRVYEMRAPLEVGWRPSPASITPALAISSLNLPISAKSSLGGITPASEFLSALTSSMNRIVSVSLGSGLRGTLLPVCRTREAGSTRPVCLLGGPVRAVVEITGLTRRVDGKHRPGGFLRKDYPD